MLAFMGFFICVFVHRNARMTEMEQSGIEVILAFADNVFAVILSQILAKSCERDQNMVYIVHSKYSPVDLTCLSTEKGCSRVKYYS